MYLSLRALFYLLPMSGALLPTSCTLSTLFTAWQWRNVTYIHIINSMYVLTLRYQVNIQVLFEINSLLFLKTSIFSHKGDKRLKFKIKLLIWNDSKFIEFFSIRSKRFRFILWLCIKGREQSSFGCPKLSFDLCLFT